jgi:hypothetical protein
MDDQYANQNQNTIRESNVTLYDIGTYQFKRDF